MEETKDFRFKNTTFRGTVSYNSKIFKYSNCKCKPECRPGFGILDVRSNKCVYNTPPHKPKTWDVLYHTRLTLWKCLRRPAYRASQFKSSNLNVTKKLAKQNITLNFVVYFTQIKALVSLSKTNYRKWLKM